jgi:hypothetical protein
MDRSSKIAGLTKLSKLHNSSTIGEAGQELINQVEEMGFEFR